MASSAPRSTTATASRSASPDVGQQYDRFIDQQLRKARFQVKLVDLLSTALGFVGGVLLYLFVIVLIDHWVFELGHVGRFVAAAGLLAGTVYYFAMFLVPLLLHRINPAYAARTIEESEPSLKNSLINYLMFRGGNSPTHRLVKRALRQRAALDLKHVNVDTAVDRSRLIHIGYAAVAVVILFAAYAFFSPKNVFQTVRRIALPWADIARPSRVRIEQVQPGDARIIFGQHAIVAAHVQGVEDGEPVTLLYSTQDRQAIDRPVIMKPAKGDIWQATLLPNNAPLEQDVSYRIEAGDATTRAFHLTVVPAPTILVDRIDYEPPAYTRMPKRSDQQQPDLRGLEGTRVTVHAVCSRPIRSAWIEFDPKQSRAGEGREPVVQRMRSRDRQATYRFVLRWDSDRSAPEYTSYLLRFTDKDGNRSTNSVLHRISVIRDLAPEVEILTPQRDLIEVPENGTRTIEIRAVDPDFGLTRISLRAVAGGARLLDKPLLEDAAGRTGQNVVRYEFSPQALQLAAGTEVTYWAVAEDNRTLQPNNDPSPNITRTRDYHILVVPARGAKTKPDATPPDAKHIAEKSPPSPGENNHSPPEANPRNADRANQNTGQDKNTGQDAGANNSTPPRQADQQQQGNQQQKADQQQSGQAGKSAGQQGAASGQTQPNASASEQQQPTGSGAAGQSGDGTEQPSKSGNESGTQISQPGQSGTGGSDQASDQNSAGSSAGSGKPASANDTAARPNQTQGGTQGMGNGPTSQGEQADSSSARSNSQPNANTMNQPMQQDTNGLSTGQSEPDGPLHDGEAIERALQYFNEQPRTSGSGQHAGAGNSKNQPNKNQAESSANNKGTQSPTDGSQNERTSSADNPSAQGAQTPKSTGESASDSTPSESRNTADQAADTMGTSPPEASDQGTAGTDTPGQAGNKNRANKESPGTSGAAKSPAPGNSQDPTANAEQGNGDSASGDSEGKQGTGERGRPGSDQRANSADETGTGSTPTGAADQDTQQQSSNAAGGGSQTEDKQPHESTAHGAARGTGTAQKQSTSGGQSGNSNASKSSASGKQSDSASPGKSGSDSSRSSSTDSSAGDSPSTAAQKGDGTSANEASTGQQTSGGQQGGKATAGDATSDKSQGSEQDANGQNESSGADGDSRSNSGASAGDKSAGQQAGQTADSSGGAASASEGGGSGHYGAVGNSESSAVPEGDAANLEYARKATDLVLKHLKDQKDKPDPELLKRLGWTAQDMRDFLRRWTQLKRAAREDKGEGKAELEDALRSLGLRPMNPVRRSAPQRSDAMHGLHDSGTRSQPPAEFRDLFRAYRKAAARN